MGKSYHLEGLFNSVLREVLSFLIMLVSSFLMVGPFLSTLKLYFLHYTYLYTSKNESVELFI